MKNKAYTVGEEAKNTFENLSNIVNLSEETMNISYRSKKIYSILQILFLTIYHKNIKSKILKIDGIFQLYKEILKKKVMFK